jgi:hypothetical protein
MHATKKLSTFQQMFIFFMGFGVFILFMTNLLMKETEQSRYYEKIKKSEKHFNTPLVSSHDSPHFPSNFDNLQDFQRQEIQQREEMELLQHSNPELDQQEFLLPPESKDETSGENNFLTADFQFSNLPEKKLPNFSNDYSEFLFNSLLEIANEKHIKYYLTTQFLSHVNLRPNQMKRMKILKSFQPLWENAFQNFQKVKYYPNGKRREQSSSNLYCRIFYDYYDSQEKKWKEHEELILGEFIPNRLSANNAVNRKVDIMRCPLNETNYHNFLRFFQGENEPSVNHRQNRALQIDPNINGIESSLENQDNNSGSRSQRHQKIHIELIKEEKPIIHYTIPWKTRMTGYLMNFLDDERVKEQLKREDEEWIPGKARKPYFPASQLSVWPSLEYDNYYNYNVFNFQPKTVLCIPQIIKPISRTNLALFLEFVSHHINVGIHHIFLPTIWSKGSIHYERLVQLFATYIAEGKLTIVSQASDYSVDPSMFEKNPTEQLVLEENAPKDGSSSSSSPSSQSSIALSEIPFEFFGVLWDKNFLKVIQSNTCLYLSKGIADYVLYLDIDQFFIPTLPSPFHYPMNTNPITNLVIQAVYSKELLDYGSDLLLKMNKVDDNTDAGSGGGGWKGGPGWADSHRHPLCYLSLDTELVLSVKGPKQYDRNWLGKLYPHGSEKNHSDSSLKKRLEQDRILLPTRSIYYTGPYNPGVCRLSWQWNGCHDPDTVFCENPMSPLIRDPKYQENELLVNHRFDEIVSNEDGKQLSRESEAVIYHYSYYDKRVSANKNALKERNLYTSTWFPLVYEDLMERGLHLLIDLPDSLPESILGKTKGLNLTILSSKDLPDYSPSMENDDIGRGNSGAMQPGMPNHPTDATDATSAASSEFSVHIPKADIVSLPSFSSDLSEVILTAMIERTEKNFDLSITMFLLNHEFIHSLIKEQHEEEAKKKEVSFHGITKVHPNTVSYWQELLSKYEETTYNPSHTARSTTTKASSGGGAEKENKLQKFQCRIRNMVPIDEREHIVEGSQEAEYVTEAIFVPFYHENPEQHENFAYSDVSLDILRCPLGNTRFLYSKYADREDSAVQVEILKNDISIIHFVVPWKSRNTGFSAFPAKISYSNWNAILKSQHKHHTGGAGGGQEEEDDEEEENVHPSADFLHDIYLTEQISVLSPAAIEPWKGYNSQHFGVWSLEKTYLAVIYDDHLDSLAHLLEFLEYYYTMIHVDHIFLGLPFAWNSYEMKLFLKMLKPYLVNHQLSITSLTTSITMTTGHHPVGEQPPHFILGGIFSELSIANFFYNSCLYYSKGLTDLLTIVRLQDFFFPKLQWNSLNMDSFATTSENEVLSLSKLLSSNVNHDQQCYYQFAVKSLIHNSLEEEGEHHPFSWIHSPSTTGGQDRPLTSSNHSAPFESIIPNPDELAKLGLTSQIYLIPPGKIYYISNEKSLVTSSLELAFYGCRLASPYNGCNDRTDFCYENDLENHQKAEDHEDKNKKLIYFDKKIGPEFVHSISEESAMVYHILEMTPEERSLHHPDLLTESLNGSLGLLPPTKDSVVSKLLAASLTEERKRFLPFLLEDYFSFSELKKMANRYGKEFLSSFHEEETIAVATEEPNSFDQFPAYSKDTHFIILSSLWTNPTEGSSKKRISHLVIAPQSSFWNDLKESSIEEELNGEDQTVKVKEKTIALPYQWEQLECKIADQNKNVLQTKIVYEEMSNGIGLLSCEFDTTDNEAGKKSADFEVTVSRPKTTFFRSETSGTVLFHHQLSNEQKGSGLLFPSSLLVDESSKEQSLPEHIYLNSFNRDAVISSNNKSPYSMSLCFSVPWENLLNKQTIALLVESLSYHYMIGIDHIYLSIRLYHQLPLEKESYLRIFQRFLEKKQLTIFFLDPLQDEKGEAKSIQGKTKMNQQLESRLLSYNQFIQNYYFTLAFLFSQTQGVNYFSVWKWNQFLVLPPVFDRIQVDLANQTVAEGEGLTKIVLPKKPLEEKVSIKEFLRQISSLDNNNKGTKNQNNKEEEEYYVFHSLSIPTRELTNSLLFLRDHSSGSSSRSHKPASSSHSFSSPFHQKVFQGEIYHSAPNYHNYFFHYYSNRYYQYGESYTDYLMRRKDYSHEIDPTIPEFDFGMIIRLSDKTKQQQNNEKEQKTVSPFLKFVWVSPLTSDGTNNENNDALFLPRSSFHVIHFSVAELYSFFDYQNLYNLQQLMFSNLERKLKNSRKSRERRTRRRLQPDGEGDGKEGEEEEENPRGDLFFNFPNQFIEHSKGDGTGAANEEDKEDEMFPQITHLIASFLNQKQSSSPITPTSEEATLPGGSSAGGGSFTSPSMAASSLLSRYSNKNQEESFSSKLNFLYFQRPASSAETSKYTKSRDNRRNSLLRSQQLNNSHNYTQEERKEILFDKNHEKNEIFLSERTENNVGYLSSTIYYTSFLQTKLALFYNHLSSSSLTSQDYQFLQNNNYYSSHLFEKVFAEMIMTTTKNEEDLDVLVSIPRMNEPSDFSASFAYSFHSFEEFLTVFKSRISHA